MYSRTIPSTKFRRTRKEGALLSFKEKQDMGKEGAGDCCRNSTSLLGAWGGIHCPPPSCYPYAVAAKSPLITNPNEL